MRLHDFLDYHARERPASEFAVQGDRRLTYQEALAQINQLANAFVDTGLERRSGGHPRQEQYRLRSPLLRRG